MGVKAVECVPVLRLEAIYGRLEDHVKVVCESPIVGLHGMDGVVPSSINMRLTSYKDLCGVSSLPYLSLSWAAAVIR